MADMIIVWDLRRFSRNFVHSAMIFEEIESNGGEIVSVSENIDNSLTGKLVRSILAWSAESEREKIVEYANRHWQTRSAQNLPLATGRAPYGWEWADKEKTHYLVHHEEALVRLSIFTMFVEQDMSVRAIAHKLTEDGICHQQNLGAGMSRVRRGSRQPSIKSSSGRRISGRLVICKTKVVTTPNGKLLVRQPNANIKTIPGGIPAIIPIELYELAQYKLKHNHVDKSRVHLKPEDFLLKSHIFCKTCGYRMGGRYRIYDGIPVGYYQCTKDNNKYDACPDLTGIKADKVNALVWADCCRVFEAIEQIRDTVRARLEQDVRNFLEHTHGTVSCAAEARTRASRTEQTKHAPGSYYYKLVTQDIQRKQVSLRKYEEQSGTRATNEQLLDLYQQNVLSFLDFLNVMKGKYREATFKEKRNALSVLRCYGYREPGSAARPSGDAYRNR